MHLCSTKETIFVVGGCCKLVDHGCRSVFLMDGFVTFLGALGNRFEKSLLASTAFAASDG